MLKDREMYAYVMNKMKESDKGVNIVNGGIESIVYRNQGIVRHKLIRWCEDVHSSMEESCNN